MRIAIAVVLLLAGCGKKAGDDARAQRCAKLYAQLEQAAAAMGASDLGGDAKGAFLANCQTVSEDLLPCLADPTSSPDCMRAHAGPPAKLTWKTVDVDHGRATVSVPDGWTHDELLGDHFTPPRSASLGFFTELTVSSSCGGVCGPLPAAEWAKRVDAELLAPARAGFVVDKDEALGATGRLLVTHNGPDSAAPVDTHVIAAFWAEGGDQYVACKAELDDEIAASLSAFEQACREVEVTSFSASEP